MVRCNHFVRRFPNKLIQQTWFSWRSIFSPLIDFGSRKLIHSPSTTKLKVIKNVEVLRCSQVRCWGGFPKRKCAKSPDSAYSIFDDLQSCASQINWSHILIVIEHQIRVWGMIFFSQKRTDLGHVDPVTRTPHSGNELTMNSVHPRKLGHAKFQLIQSDLFIPGTKNCQAWKFLFGGSKLERRRHAIFSIFLQLQKFPTASFPTSFAGPLCFSLSKNPTQKNTAEYQKSDNWSRWWPSR